MATTSLPLTPAPLTLAALCDAVERASWTGETLPVAAAIVRNDRAALMVEIPVIHSRAYEGRVIEVVL
ncbi:MAG: hypothetical protein JSS77_16120 [Acidobacteria bacterium]|nr:hypothetical protein [Acidobacteriota bacterium]